MICTRLVWGPTRYRNLVRLFTQFAFSPPTILTCSFAAAVVTTTRPACIRRTIHETRIHDDFLVMRLVGFGIGAIWNVSTRFSRQDAHGRLPSRSPRLHGGLRWACDRHAPGFLPRVHAGLQ